MINTQKPAEIKTSQTNSVYSFLLPALTYTHAQHFMSLMLMWLITTQRLKHILEM